MPINDIPIPIVVTSSTSLQDTVTAPSRLNGVFAPIRPAPIISRSENNQLLSLQNSVSALQKQVASPTSSNAPKQVTGVSATESPYTTSAGSQSLVSVDFIPGSGDPYFGFVQIYFSGYNGNPNPQLMTQGAVSPIQFLCESTHEVVTVTVVTVSADNIPAPFANAPTITVSLDGVNSAPPAPSIAAAQTALPHSSGWQFAFNLIGGLEAEAGLVSGYRVYHSESNVAPTPPDGYYSAYPQPSTGAGQIVVQETTPDILWYWISAYNDAGFESALTPVPFVYVDPGAPAPPAPTPVQTTKTYAPTTLLNGWAANAHVGYWEPTDNTFVLGLEPTAVNPFTSPQNAYDGNQSTPASYADTHNASYAGCVWSFAGFPGLQSGATVASASLSIVSDVVPTSGPVHGQGSVWISTDGGTTWSNVYSAISTTRIKHTDTVSIPVGTDFTKLQVMAFAHSHDDLAMHVYEISLSIVQSAAAGPEKVTGVTASLVSGNVQVNWNSLTPTTRTDVTGYEVTRVVHGGGYSQSKTQITIPWTGASTYSWVDSGSHDGAYDYYIVAVNPTGYSQPSDAANLTGASSMLYASGATVESLEPAQAGADVTAGQSLTVLTDRTLDNISDGSGRYAAAESDANNTAAHVLTSNASIPSWQPSSGDWQSDGTTNVQPIPGLGWTAQSSGPGDTYNVTAMIDIHNAGTLYLFVDGNTSVDYSHQIQLPIVGGSSYAPVVIFGTVTGLTPGTHTIQFYVKPGTDGTTGQPLIVFVYTNWATIQRIY